MCLWVIAKVLLGTAEVVNFAVIPVPLYPEYWHHTIHTDTHIGTIHAAIGTFSYVGTIRGTATITTLVPFILLPIQSYIGTLPSIPHTLYSYYSTTHMSNTVPFIMVLNGTVLL